MLLSAYDDSLEVTAALHPNLLASIASWAAISLDGQRSALTAGETIHTESSRQYEIEGFNVIAARRLAPGAAAAGCTRPLAVVALEVS